MTDFQLTCFTVMPLFRDWYCVFSSSSRIQTQHFGVKVSIVEYSFFYSGVVNSVVNSDYHGASPTSQDIGTG